MRRIEMPEFCVCVRMVRALRAHARAFAAVMLGVGVSLLLAGAAFAQEASGAAPVGNALLPRDLSPWGMFLNADVVVQAVLVGLVIASVVTWTVWLAKTLELIVVKRRVRADLTWLGRIRSSEGSLERLVKARSIVGRFIAAAVAELQLSGTTLEKDGIKERIASRLERIEAASARSIARGTGVLATIGATAPFVGLFGTVWGIMNSFIGISAGDRARPCRRHSGGGHLQCFLPPDCRLSCAGGGRLRRGDAAGQSRPRPGGTRIGHAQTEVDAVGRRVIVSVIA